MMPRLFLDLDGRIVRIDDLKTVLLVVMKYIDTLSIFSCFLLLLMVMICVEVIHTFYSI